MYLFSLFWKSYQEVFFENGNSKVATWNITILTLKEMQKGIHTVKDLYCQILVKFGHHLNQTAILKNKFTDDTLIIKLVHIKYWYLCILFLYKNDEPWFWLTA